MNKESFLAIVNKKSFKRIMCIVLILTLILVSVIIWTNHRHVYGTDLMTNITAQNAEGKDFDSLFFSAFANFSVNLFKELQITNENILISPVSIYLSLAMAANGASGDTLKQFEQVLGNGVNIDDINKYVYTFINNLPSDEDYYINILNSVWVNKKLGRPNKNFLQKGADYYKANAYMLNFDDTNSMDKINNWIKDNTDGIVEKVLNEIKKEDVIYLINTLFFDGKWETNEFKENGLINDVFYISENKGIKTEFMKASLKYIKDSNSTGFICPYKEGYSFVALLPENNLSVDEYINGLTADKLLNIIDFETEKKCIAVMPKFKYEYNSDLKNALSNIGLSKVFNEQADFSRIGNFVNVKIGEVIHKTSIEVNEERTRAGAGSVVRIPTIGVSEELNYVNLNKPFVYAIIDNNTKLPLFLGKVNTIDGEVIDVNGEIPKGQYKVETGDYRYTVFDTNNMKFMAKIDKYIGNSKEVIVPLYYEDSIKHEIVVIEAKSFSDNQYIETLTINNELLYIGDKAFANCPNLKDIYIRGNNYFIEYFGKSLFEGSENVIIHCYENSIFHKYAIENDIQFNLEKRPVDD